MVIFAWVFPEDQRIPKKKTAVLFAPGIILVPAAFLGLLWHKAAFIDGRFEIDLAPLAYFFVGYVYFVFLFGTVVLFRKYWKYRDTIRGQQIGAILWALLITSLLNTVSNILLPYFGNYELLPYSPLFFLPGVLVYAYAISSFKLFSLQTALDQFRLFGITSKIALSIASVAVISFGIFQIPIVWWSFQEGLTYDGWKKYLVFSVISALVPNILLLLLVVRTVSRPLQRITTAAVFVTNGKYGTEVDMRKSNDEIGLLANSFNEMSRKMAADIDQLKQLNEKLIRTEKLAAMGTLSAGLAHEVNNPLASISSLVQMLQTEEGLDTETRDKLKVISSQITRISQVTKDMMDFARMRPAARTECNVHEIIEKSLRLASFDKEFSKLTIRRDYSPASPSLVADPDQLQQVFLNLLLNARDAMPDGGEIRIGSVYDGNSISLTFSDSGKGIEEKDISKIFDPFFTTKAGGKGTGLGLAVCYGIVTAHSGHLEASRNVEGGMDFVISLPVPPKTH
jgi:signal transduction histidine kinase